MDVNYWKINEVYNKIKRQTHRNSNFVTAGSSVEEISLGMAHIRHGVRVNLNPSIYRWSKTKVCTREKNQKFI